MQCFEDSGSSNHLCTFSRVCSWAYGTMHCRDAGRDLMRRRDWAEVQQSHASIRRHLRPEKSIVILAQVEETSELVWPLEFCRRGWSLQCPWAAWPWVPSSALFRWESHFPKQDDKEILCMLCSLSQRPFLLLVELRCSFCLLAVAVGGCRFFPAVVGCICVVPAAESLQAQSGPSTTVVCMPAIASALTFFSLSAGLIVIYYVLLRILVYSFYIIIISWFDLTCRGSSTPGRPQWSFSLLSPGHGTTVLWSRAQIGRRGLRIGSWAVEAWSLQSNSKRCKPCTSVFFSSAIAGKCKLLYLMFLLLRFTILLCLFMGETRCDSFMSWGSTSFNESLIPVEESGLTAWKQGLENWASDVARMLSRRQGGLKAQQCPCGCCW